METNRLIQIASNYMNIWNVSGDHWLDQFASENIKINYSHFLEPLKGKENYRRLLQFTYRMFPDLKISIIRVIPCTAMATVHFSYTGTHAWGKLFGAEPSGKEVQVNGITILEIENDKVIKECGIVDNLALVHQIGAMVTPQPFPELVFN